MTTRPPALLLLILFASAAPAEGSRRAFTLGNLYRVKSVGEPAISPDGKTVVYSVATNDWAAKKKTVALWRIDADGKNARPLTFSGANDEHPFFSPDGRTLAFVSTRAGDPQVFFLPLEGGEPEQKTFFPAGGRAVRVRPRGRGPPAGFFSAARGRRAGAEDLLPRRSRGSCLLGRRPSPRLLRGRFPRLRRGRRVQPQGHRGAREKSDKGASRRRPSLPALDGMEGRQARARSRSRPSRDGREEGPSRPHARRF